MSGVLKVLFFALVVRPVMILLLGVNIRNRERLPETGPAIVVANHNSHLDTMALMAMFPLRRLSRIRPVAAEDYFGGGGVFGWFAREVVGIIGIARKRSGDENPLAPAEQALDRGEILILYPEGSRGEPERLAAFKKGVAHLALARPGARVIPVFLHGFGKALPKGTILFVPFNCDVFAGDSLPVADGVEDFMAKLETAMAALAQQGRFAPWD